MARRRSNQGRGPRSQEEEKEKDMKQVQTLQELGPIEIIQI